METEHKIASNNQCMFCEYWTGKRTAVRMHKAVKCDTNQAANCLAPRQSKSAKHRANAPCTCRMYVQWHELK